MVKGKGKMNGQQVYKIAIVGFGPKGLYGFERLLAFIKDQSVTRKVEVHLFNATQFFGAGDVYRIDQPHYLIMNYANKNINMWPKESPSPIAPYTPDFSTWLHDKKLQDTTSKFAARAMVGSYLRDGYNELLNHLPDNVKIVPHVGWVVNVEESPLFYKISYTNEKKEILQLSVNNILFTTGHITFKSHVDAQKGFSNEIDFIYPTNEKLSVVTPGSSVGIKGMGLTCIDALLALTEGRGGKFTSTKDGSFTYLTSGEEPKQLYVYSRSGLPMVPRNGNELDDKPLYYFTKDALAQLKGNGPVNFNASLLPLIKKEFYWSYYSTLFRNYNLELKANADFDKIKSQVAQFHKQFSDTAYFSWQNIVNPFAKKTNITKRELQDYIQFLIDEAEIGPDKSPFVAAVSTWRRISPLFNEIYSYGGLDAASHKEFDTYYFGLFNRLAYGPPIVNMQKILALVKCGLLNLSYAKSARVEKDVEGDSWSLIGDKGKKASIQFLLHATIPRAGQHGFQNELYQNLSKNKLVATFRNTEKSVYVPGCIALDKNGHPINEYGKVNKDLVFYGTPTEGITYDNDTLSRTRNDFATNWAKRTCAALEYKKGTTAYYEREEHVL